MAGGASGLPPSPMTERDAQIDGFLAAHGWAGASRAPLAGDASARRYERIAEGRRRAVLMDAPPEREALGPFMLIDRYLRSRGYSAPEIYAADEACGLMLLEDLGDRRYTELTEGGFDQETLFSAAIDVLIDLHDEAPTGLDIARLDSDRLLAQVEILIDLYLPEITGAPASDGQRAGFLAAWRAVLPLAEAIPTTLVLYDYHAPNLMWLPERRGVARVGLLDFQDAMIGPLAFDVVSLLENPRQDIDPALAEAMAARYLDRRPEIDRGDFRAAYAVLGAQRVTRNMGNFTRLWRHEGKPEYMDHLPRLWRLLDHSLAHPALAPVAAWFDGAIPRDKRRGLP
jgi:aminoglycoside/choline kinase family phosphotransferase